MNLVDYGTIEVCTDCYFALHYGAHEIKPEDADQYNPAGWYTGQSDTPCDFEPLSDIASDFIVEDGTCSDHEVTYHTEPDPDDEDDWIDVPDPCQHCGRTGWEDPGGTGITNFSHGSCDGCESHLAGTRYRLSLWKQEEANAT